MKVCPICKAGAFDDAKVCFGCLYKFGEESPASNQGPTPVGAVGLEAPAAPPAPGAPAAATPETLSVLAATATPEAPSVPRAQTTTGTHAQQITGTHATVSAEAHEKGAAAVPAQRAAAAPTQGAAEVRAAQQQTVPQELVIRIELPDFVSKSGGRVQTSTQLYEAPQGRHFKLPLVGTV